MRVARQTPGQSIVITPSISVQLTGTPGGAHGSWATTQSHVGAARHSAGSARQRPAGAPASAASGPPQIPAMHAEVQHSAGVEHGSPGAPHPCPTRSQYCDVTSVHVTLPQTNAVPQTPSVHRPSQHSQS